ncbi:protein phosphatase 1 regulatory inhibitor subunit 16B-like [Polyodon spathula]|uniref:protein phosphatase 1 regulatory inhibitor subunit 16B-like n=1 Tax=Polyodon spathula TaxID=7913 RepID=UPI001B7DDCB8|nr:protein phosphatase 1 regulatory inhibitor subunit 16B-like [Polyodon spathula]
MDTSVNWTVIHLLNKRMLAALSTEVTWGPVNDAEVSDGSSASSLAVRYLLRNSVDPNLCNDDGLTALHQCCIDNYEEIAKILLNRGANVNARDNELWTPLHAAATCGHASLVKVLIQQGADLLAVNSDGNMPYDLCEDDPTLDIIEMAMTNRGITQEMINEVRVAVEKRMISDIQELLQSHQDLNKTDKQGATLLHIAAANERPVLISSPSFQLHIAAANERPVLISSPSFQLHIAAANERPVLISSPSFQLHIAAANERPVLISSPSFQLHIAAANERPVLISSPSFQLHIAAANERRVLISSPSFQLHIAAANGYIQAAELLLEHGARVNIRDFDGWLPLHAAACWGQIQVAELLVSHGASLNAKTYLDETPIDLCENEEFKAMLLDLKHKHDIIMKSQLTHKTSLCRRTSSAGSRGKVVRRASVSDLNNLYRKEYETEAIVWLGGKKPEEREEDERERESDQENPVPQKATPEKTPKPAKEQKPTGSTPNGKISLSSTSTHPPCNGDAPRSPSTPEPPSSLTDPWAAYNERSHQTLAELKRQRAATKLLSHPLLNGHLANGTSPAESRLTLVSSNGSSVYYTVTSGDPPLLRLKQPVEEVNVKAQGCCTIS